MKRALVGMVVIFCGRIMKYFVCCLGFFVFFEGNAQSVRLGNHYFLNPALYNPAFVGYDGYSIMHINNRQQWKGIDGAPTTTSFFLYVPLEKVSLGFNAFHEQNGIFNLSSVQFTYSYKVPFSSDQGLRFGLSAGVGMNSVDLGLVNITDPVVAGIVDNSFNLIGDLGMVYYFRSFYLGISMPDIFRKRLVNTSSFNEIKIAPAKNFTVLAKYEIQFPGEKISFEPNIVYRMLENGPGQFEGLGIVRYMNTVWLGGSYRQGYGLTALGGINLIERFKIGYGYEIASSQVSGFSNGSHEIHLAIKLGKKEEPRKHGKASGNNFLDQFRIKDDQVKHKSRYSLEKVNSPNRQTAKTQAKTYYLVVNTFKDFKSADIYANKLVKQKFDAQVGYDDESKKYFVWLSQSDNYKKLKRTSKKLSKIRRFRKAQVISSK